MTGCENSHHLIVVMGVAGCGKTTVGRALAAKLGWPYFEADDFHPQANVEKMSRGEPLTDSDRAPWLKRIRAKIEECASARQSAVFTCSALKSSYRGLLASGLSQVRFVHLELNEAEALARVSRRQGHFMRAEMVRSQFAALEAPQDAWRIDARKSPEEIVAQIVADIGRDR